MIWPEWQGGQRPVVDRLEDISPEALDALRIDIRNYLEQNPPATPITQLMGFNRVVYQRATELPSNPVDGQWLALELGSNWIWQLRYIQDFTDQYKWLFVGGVPQEAIVIGTSSTTSNTYVDLGGPSLTCQVSGIYNIQLETYVEFPGFGGDEDGAWMSVSIGGSAPSDADALSLKIVNGNSVSVTIGVFIMRVLQKTLTKNQVVAARYRTNAAWASWSNRRMVLTPVRVG
jgi:hypothetical protein